MLMDSFGSYSQFYREESSNNFSIEFCLKENKIVFKGEKFVFELFQKSINLISYNNKSISKPNSHELPFTFLSMALTFFTFLSKEVFVIANVFMRINGKH